MEHLIKEMMALAEAGMPFEVCGLVASSEFGARLIPAKNLHARPREEFSMDPDCWLEVGPGEEVTGIYHSHPVTGVEPSPHDLVSCEESGVPWHIVNPQTQAYNVVNPSGYQAPYTQRPYIHGVLDCYAVVRDWYNREWNLGLVDYPRQDGWWDKGQNLYLEHFSECGFVCLDDDYPVEVGDAFLIQRGARVPNHAAVYVGDGAILHHVYGRLSVIEAYGGDWLRKTTHHLRHKSRMTNG